MSTTGLTPALPAPPGSAAAVLATAAAPAFAAAAPAVTSSDQPRRRPFTQADRPLVAGGLFLGFFLVVVVPALLMALWSVAERWAPPDLVPQSYTMAHWHKVTDDAGIFRALLNSTLIAVAVTALTSVIALPTAWALARFPFRLKRLVEILVLAPVIVPGLIVAVGVGQVFLFLGLAYSVTGVILVQLVGTLPFMIRLMAAAFSAIPDDLIHAARALGARPHRILLHVVLPLAVPGLLAGGLLSFVGSFEEFDKSFIVGAPVVETLPIKLYTFLDPYSLQFPTAAVVALVLLVPVLVIFVLAGRIMRDDLLSAGMGKV